MAELLSGTYVLEKMVSLFIGDGWKLGKDKIKEVYAIKKGIQQVVSFESMMYTALIDCFCAYCGKNPNKLSENEIQGFFDIVDRYMAQTRKKYVHYDEILLKTLNSLSNNYNITWLEITDTQKIELFDELLLIYISQHEELRIVYNLKTQSNIFKQTDKSIDLLENMAKQIAECRSEYVTGINNIIQYLNDIKNEILTILTRSKEPHIQEDSPSFTNNAIEDYITKWNKRLFLHQRPEDQDLTLENTYIAPPYKNIYPEEDDCSKDNLNERLDDFYKNGKSLLLIGPPGIGKTSVVCYLANKYKDDPNVIILRFSDWENDEWSSMSDMTWGSALGIAVLERLNCKKIDLTNKLLILDGYDELNYYDKYFLETFFMFVEGLKNFRLIITSRENYVKNSFQLFQYVIKLQPFDAEIIPRYVEKITQSKNGSFKSSNLVIDEDVLGIPVILYMALSTGIDITNQENRCSMYEKIFSLNGGIFDRFAVNFLAGYEQGSHVIRYKKEAFSTILCNTAFTMFENANLKLSFDKYKEIIAREDINFINSPLWLDFPIDNLFDKSKAVEFVHKSIYEYFTAEYIYRKFVKLFDKAYHLSNLSNEETEELGNEICEIISANIFSDEICEFLCHKINSSEFKVDTYYKFILMVCKQLLDVGPIYYVKKSKLKELMYNNQRIKNTAHIENNLLVNIMHIIHLWDFIRKENIPMFLDIRLDLILNYLRVLNPVAYNFYINLSHMNLSNDASSSEPLFKQPENLLLDYIDLTGSNLLASFLSRVIFVHGSFSYCNFSNISMSYVQFTKCEAKMLKLENANLRFLDFEKSDLCNANLSKSTITCTKFEACDLTNANFHNTVAKEHVQILHSTLNGADLTNSILEGVVFSFSCFEKTVFCGGKFNKAKFYKANLKGADLRGGVFTGADFRGADLSVAIYDHELDDAIL